MKESHTKAGGFIKDVIDRAGSLVALILLSPLFFFIMIKVRKDGGPIFYGHKRLGRNGKTFKCWKFRSMIVNADKVLAKLLATDAAARAEWEQGYKLKNDPRITKIGHFLRKTSLDELPQLFNVLKGEMSLVGPRPIVEEETRYYGDNIQSYFAARPGMTGLWQISGRSDTSYEQRVYLDTFYVANWSVWNDLKIIFKTFFIVLNRTGAY